MRHDHPIA